MSSSSMEVDAQERLPVGFAILKLGAMMTIGMIILSALM